MALQVRDGGSLQTITDLTIPQAGVDRRIGTLKVLDGDELRTVAQFADPLSASITPALVGGTEATDFTVAVTSNAANALPSGGRGPFSYRWVRLSGDFANAVTPTGASTRFEATLGPGQAALSTFQVTVTDSAGQTATAQVDASLRNTGGSGEIEQ